MPQRTLGVTLLCGFFAIAGVGGIASGLALFGAHTAAPTGTSASVVWFLRLMPVLLLLLGAAALPVAYWLWTGARIGRPAGLAWLAVWIANELVLLIWIQIGPALVRAASDGAVGPLLRIGISGLLFYYLWSTRWGDPATSNSPASA